MMAPLDKYLFKMFKQLTFPLIKKDFIKRISTNIKFSAKEIKDLLDKFDICSRNIKCGHSKGELFIMFAMILSLEINGPIFELGCYKGGSTSKLSLLCELTGRKLYVFDSFEGLPVPGVIDQKHNYMPWIINKKFVKYSKGNYYGSLNEVKENINKYGSINVCTFIKGYFQESLPNFKINPACIFMDVDYIESARTIIKYLWPKLLPNGILFTHDIGSIDFCDGITDSKWWAQELNQYPPTLYGAGYGTCWRVNYFALSSNIGYFIKKKSLTLES